MLCRHCLNYSECDYSSIQIVKIYQEDIIEKWTEYHGEDK